MSSRIHHAGLAQKVMSGADAAAMIHHGDNVGFSGFTGAGYPKDVPRALAGRIKAAHDRGEEFRIGVWTGASTAPELDGALAEVDGISTRVPYQSDPVTRAKINSGDIDYVDIHLSHLNQYVEHGFMGRLDFAVVEVTAITPGGRLVPSASVGCNRTYLDKADKIILEVNAWQPAEIEGVHDIWRNETIPNRHPVPILHPGDRIGTPYFEIDTSKVVAVVETDAPDRNSPFKPIDDTSRAIASHFIDFLKHEVKKGRLPKKLLPLQSGVGNIANAVLDGLHTSPWAGKGLGAYTEVLQDGMLDLIDDGTFSVASCTALSLSPEGVERFNRDVVDYLDKVVMRPQSISNHPEVVRRLGVISCNGLIEADLYGNVNSTHVIGSRIQNGIGGSADFTHHGYLTTFVTPSTAKGGALSCIVPMVSHVDHTEHDVMVMITEQGLADLRGLAPRKRAQQIIDHCAHPDFRPLLQDYFDRACAGAWGQQTPHLLGEAFSFHQRFMETGSMSSR
ncbi:acetyl-CoA hydrolase/transferase family protein [Arsenicicoccus piscis]|uniref:acetyl-CoA hydrolase/transferase family protein n=2 Tax=Arsenicicoccus piscis TaxID=673954 RepID=UPI001F4CB8D6|nr:acetyl-CoA hydrolase/transferase family protein [Arsenicicoccus piscis]MCH8627925.1 acetyl-CoA hydrolase/transferase family protein [Arsenicicoccus piscis]